MVQVKTSPVPVKDDYFAAVKSNNYLPNVLALMDAEVRLSSICDIQPIGQHSMSSMAGECGWVSEDETLEHSWYRKV